MPTPEELVNHILHLIDRWELSQARKEYARLVPELSDADSQDLAARLREREILADRITTAIDLIESQPDEALDQLEKLDAVAQSHPEYASAVQRAKIAAAEARREEAQNLCAEAEDLARDARLWSEAEAKIRQLEGVYSSWATDPGLRPRVESVKDQIEDGKKAEEKLSLLDRALHDGNWTLAQELLNELEAFGNVPDEELDPRRVDLEKLHTRAMGRSTRQVFDTEVANLRAALDSLEGAQNWRAAYNNLQRLINALRQVGQESEAAKESQKAEPYLEALRQSVYKTVDDRLAEAQTALEKGRLTKARELVLAAARAGVPPEFRPGEPVDVAGEVQPLPDQDKQMANILGEIEEKEAARGKATEHVEAALQCLRQRTLESLHDARTSLQRARTQDLNFPGLDALETDVENKIHTAMQARVKTLGSRLERAAARGEVEVAHAIVAELRFLGPEAGDLSEYEQVIEEAEGRRREVEDRRSEFQTLFDNAQDELDCSQAQRLSDILNQWSQVAFDPSGPTNAQVQLDRFRAECEELALCREAVLAALQTRNGLNAQVQGADRLAQTSVGSRPAIAGLLARFWQAMAEQHGAHGADLGYLRKAQRLAERTGDQFLQSQLATEIERALSRTQEGRRLASIEQRLRDYQERDDWQAGLQLIDSLPQDDPVRSDPTVSLLISEINGGLARRRADDLLDVARQAYRQGDFKGALDVLDESLQEILTLNARTLHTEIKQRLAWEKRKSAVLDAALQVDVTDPDRVLSFVEQQQLAEGKAIADEIAQIQTSLELARKADLVTATYAQWRAKVESRLEQLAEEASDRIDNLEFSEALSSIREAGQAGVPEDLAPDLIQLRREVQKGKWLSDRVRNRIEQAKTLAAQGQFNPATRMLNLRDSEVPERLKDECIEWQTLWSESIRHYAELQNSLPEMRKSVQDCLPPSSGANPSEKSLDEVAQEIGERVQQAAALDLSEKEAVRESYAFLQQVLQWLHDVVRTSESASTQLNDLKERRSKLATLVGKGEELGRKLPLNLQGLAIPLNQRMEWLKERGRVVDKLLRIVEGLSAAGTFRSSLRSPFAGERETLQSLQDLTQAEEHARERLRQSIRNHESEQTRNTVYLAIFPLFLIGLISGLLFLLNRPKGPVVVPTPTPTNTPIVITATPGPTKTPTLTLTPTITLTPTPTPEVVAQCVSNGQRWVFSEPGHNQDDSDRQYRAGYVLRGESVGILRDIPGQAELQRDWIKILIRRGDAEFRGWIRREWANCP